MIHTLTISHIVPDDAETITNKKIFEQLELESSDKAIKVFEKKDVYKKISLIPRAGITLTCTRINMDKKISSLDYKYFINAFFNPMEMICDSRIHNLDELDIPMIREYFNDALKYIDNELFLDFSDWQVKRIDVRESF